MLSMRNVDNNKKEILELFSTIDREGIDSLASWYSRSDFFEAPASTRFHGNFHGGLAAHSLGVYHAFNRRLDEYNIPMEEESRIIAALGH